MKKLLYFLFATAFTSNAFAQIPDPCTGAGGSQAISTASPCNCGEAQSGTSCTKSVYTTQLAADNDIHTFLTTQSGYARPTTPTLWQDLRGDNMMLDGTGIWKHEFSTEITTGPSTTLLAVLNICQVQINCNAVCQDYKIIQKIGGTCGINISTPVLITSSLDPTVKYRQYNVSPNTTYIVSRQIYYDGNNFNCFLSWTGTDGQPSTGAKITAQHWFIWSTTGIVLPVKNLQLSAKQLNKAVMVQWSTEQEINSSVFEIEKSIDGFTFSKIGERAASGNAYTQNNYWLEDADPAAVNFYRVKAIDKDGKTALSSVAKLVFKTGAKTSVIIVPNPAKDIANIVLESSVSSIVAYKIINVNGQPVQTGILHLQKGLNKISKDVAALGSGIYLFVTELNHQIITAKFSKQ